MSAAAAFREGDLVWVRTGRGHEEPATVLEVSSPEDVPATATATASPAENEEITVKFTVSGHESVVTVEEIRLMENHAASDHRDGSGRKVRRSARSSSSGRGMASSRGEAVFPSSSVPSASLSEGDTKKECETNGSGGKKAVRVTPSPTECESFSMDNDESGAASGNASGNGMEIEDVSSNNAEDELMMKKEDEAITKPDTKATRAARKRKQTTQPDEKKKDPPRTNKRGKRSSIAEKSQEESKDSGIESPKESPYFSKESIKMKETESPYFAKGTKKKLPGASRGKPSLKPSRTAKADATLEEGITPAAKKKPTSRRKLILAASDGEDVEGANQMKKAKTPPPAAKDAVKKKSTKSKTAGDKSNHDDEGELTTPKPTPKPKAKTSKAPKDKPPKGSTDSATRKSTATPRPRPEGGQPDGNGSLNQPTPFRIEYAPTGRATCRTCDERIEKGTVRVGHCPLFRGKPGYVVFRHLECTIFSEDVTCAQDVEEWEGLEEEELERLEAQVEVSKEKIREEMEELEPDELVQKSFGGEIRKEPKGLCATLLPFQVEGFSWMRHQEVEEAESRGGILADEMGMGKTLQTIATILDHRPKLQHSKPGAKHPPTDDMEERHKEEALWDKVAVDWKHEMDMLKVMKKIRSKDGGARAGTLVICPVIALTQWRTEIEKFTEDGTLTVCTYHGPDREAVTPREMMKKYDVVLTTYQVLEADFRKMTSPNRVACPNCGKKFKIDKLPIHLKYFCGENAQRTEAQARQQRNSERHNGAGNRRIRGRANDDEDDEDDDSETNKKASKKKSSNSKMAKKIATKSEKKDSKVSKKKTVSKVAESKNPRKDKVKKKPQKKVKAKRDEDDFEEDKSPTRTGSRRSAALKAASQISKSADEWMPQNGDSDSDNYRSDVESSSESDSDDDDNIQTRGRGKKYASESDDDDDGSHASSSSEDSAMARARAKQQKALERSRMNKKTPQKKRAPVKETKKSFSKGSKGKGKDKGKGKGINNGKDKLKRFDDGDDDYDSSDDGDDSLDFGGGNDDIDMDLLIQEAMAGAKNSILHSLCWWRIILDEAHMIKTRSSQTANAAFSLVGIHRWALSGTPLQNRVGEFYSLVRFLRLDPMAYYYCRLKDCDCKSMHYRIFQGKCDGCGHGGVHHYSHFNRYVLNPIQRDGYSGDGRRAMFTLKNEVLDKCLLRRTKETKAADMELPPRLVQIKPVRLHPVEEDFYAALYTQTKSSFNDYIDSGTLLNNYAHIFDLLIRMRQSVDHPYLVVHSNKSSTPGTRSEEEQARVANGSINCDLCHEPPTGRVVSTCCGAAYCRSCVVEYMAGMAAAGNMTCPSCRAAFSIDLEAQQDIEDDTTLKLDYGARKKVGVGSDDVGMPSLKELPHVATGSILRRINLAEFATSSKIEALTQELVTMRQTSPGSKAIVFSQFVNMLDLIRWRLHSDPYLEDIGLGARALHGGMNVKARDQVLKEFREDNEVRVLLMSLKAGGVALNLTCANYIFLMDPWWNPAAEMQAIDRTHRLGQYRPIRAIRFIAENTVEERILQLQEKKRLVFDGTVGRDAGSLKMLTVDDMKSLFA